MNKKIVFFTAIFISLLVVILIIYFDNKIVDDNSGFTLKEDLYCNVFDKVTVNDFIVDKDLKIINSDKIDTKILGTKEISFIYLNYKGKKRRGTFKIKVIDDEAPIIWLNERYFIKVNSDDNLDEKIMCADNYDNRPNCKIKGEYDLTKTGNYNLDYVAIDSSNNQKNVKFTLVVYDEERSENTSLKSFTDFNYFLENYKNDNTLIGIDVSKWQGKIDFEKVKAAGSDFVMIRLGTQDGINGKYVIDPYFKENIKSATDSGLKVGVYFYSYANSLKEAKKQAKWVVQNIKPYNITLPVALDWECYSYFNQMEISLFGLNEISNEFLKIIKKEGYDVMLYGSKNYLNSVWKYNNYDVWLAHYTKNTDYDKPFLMWQLCQNGKIDGIDTFVDINVLYR